MGKISVSKPKNSGEFCDNCRKETSVVRVTDGGLVLFYVCRQCSDEIYESVKRAFAA